MLTLLALALPTSALANSIDPPPRFSFFTGTFASGLVTAQNNSLGWNMNAAPAINVIGSMWRIRIDTGPLSSGCQTNGTCTWTGGTLLVRTAGNVAFFTTTLLSGTLTKNGDDVTIMAELTPNLNGVGPAGGTVSYNIELGPRGEIAGGNARVNIVPEPSTLLSLGTGLLGLAGMMRRKLKLWT